MLSSAELAELVQQQHTAVMAAFQRGETRTGELDGRLRSIEQRMGRREGGDPAAPRTWGGEVVASADYASFIGSGARGSTRIKLPRAAITSAPNSAGAMIAPDRQSDVVVLPRRRLTVRQLLQPGQTASNLVQFTKQTLRSNQARPVTEGASKPESNYEFELAEAPVRTLAHWVPITRQAMDDAPQLQAVIDGELRYGLETIEETQILLGDGTGQNLHGLIPQATPYAPQFPVTGEQELDTILMAIAQAETSNVPATGIVLNDLDWRKMQALKDGEDRYLGAGPFGAVAPMLWNLPVVATPAMPAGEFLVGAFAIAAQIIDRAEIEVLLSSEDRDNFIKNMLTARAEERVALAVKIPQALVTGEFPALT
jgi:HK97 family phage major capsid protein